MSNVTTPSSSFLLHYESEFDPFFAKQWLLDHWSLPVLSSGLYMVTIFTLTRFMSNRTRFDLRPHLITWSLSLAVFSIIGVCKTLPEFVDTLLNRGFEASMCDTRFLTEDSLRSTSFWGFLFVLSKLPELGDTLFIVLRKQPLIFLHWYHHVTVLLYTWFSWSQFVSTGRWFICMNYFVHSVMYSYYFLRASGYKLHKALAMLVTSLQLFQMVAGIYVNVNALRVLSSGRDCHVTKTNIMFSLLMYFSYMILFGNFFYKTYIARKAVSKEKAQQNGRRKQE